jgi:hypothetical protein
VQVYPSCFLLVRSIVGETPLLVALLFFCSQAMLEVSVSRLDFGVVALGEIICQKIEIFNPGTEDAHYSCRISVDGGCHAVQLKVFRCNPELGVRFGF